MTHTSRLQCTGRPRYSSPGRHRLSGRDDSSIGQNSFKIGTVTQSFGPSLMGRSWPAESFTIRSARSGLKHTHIRPQGSLRDKIQVLKKPIFSCCTTDKKEHMLLPKIQKPRENVRICVALCSSGASSPASKYRNLTPIEFMVSLMVSELSGATEWEFVRVFPCEDTVFVNII